MIGGDISSFIAGIRSECPDIASIWLIGSRANGGATESSDWDFIAIADKQTLSKLENLTELHRPDVDFFVVVDGDNFQCAWGERDKTGSLSSWEWDFISDTQAEYTGAKELKNEEGRKVVLNRCAAIRV